VTAFPRTMVGGVSLPRLLVGTNWFLGYSHTSLAKDRFIKDYQNPKQIADVLEVFLEYGIDAVMGPLSQILEDGVRAAEDRTGKEVIRILMEGRRYDSQPVQPDVAHSAVIRGLRKLADLTEAGRDRRGLPGTRPSLQARKALYWAGKTGRLYGKPLHNARALCIRHVGQLVDVANGAL